MYKSYVEAEPTGQEYIAKCTVSELPENPACQQPVKHPAKLGKQQRNEVKQFVPIKKGPITTCDDMGLSPYPVTKQKSLPGPSQVSALVSSPRCI